MAQGPFPPEGRQGKKHRGSIMMIKHAAQSPSVIAPYALLAALLIPATASADPETVVSPLEAQNQKEVLAKWIASAEEGDPVAQNRLCMAYKYGQGVQKNMTKAFEWCCKAAEQGNSNAQHAIAWMYLMGQGVATDSGQGWGWLRKYQAGGTVYGDGRLWKLQEKGNMLQIENEVKFKFPAYADKNPHCLGKVRLDHPR